MRNTGVNALKSGLLELCRQLFSFFCQIILFILIGNQFDRMINMFQCFLTLLDSRVVFSLKAIVKIFPLLQVLRVDLI
jgi:hypothetical protein